METRRMFGKMVVAGLAANRSVAQQLPQSPPASGSGFETPEELEAHPVGAPIPGQKWKVHDRSRPQPRKITPGLPIASSPAPSDAIILFDGKDLSQWVGAGRGAVGGDPHWKVEDGYVELVPRSGSMATKAKFGDCQLHVEWMNPPVADPKVRGQERGNSGVILMGKYEIQVLSSYNNPTYADGMAGAIYALYPPMVNPCRPEGDWNSYDLLFEAPRFEGSTVAKPGYVTLIFNGVMVHHHAQLIGSTAVKPLAQYQPHAPEESFVLQGHAGPVRYRNIWIRKIAGYDA
jgi:hypothetical protein